MISCVDSSIIAPLAVAVHRYILLGERDDRVFWRWRPEVPKFLGWLVINDLVTTASSLLATSSLISLSLLTYIVIGCGLAVLEKFIFVRAMLIFPATAGKAPGSFSENGWRISRGHFWYFSSALLCVSLPIAVAILLQGFGFNIGISTRCLNVIVIIAEPLNIGVLATLASLLYRKFGGALPPASRTADLALSRA